MRTLVSHFWRLVLSSGTRPLRWVSVLGATAVLLAPVIALVLGIGEALGSWDAPGWTSTMILLMVATGVILFSLGVIAEYVGIAVNMAMGKPSTCRFAIGAAGPRPRREMTTRPTQPLTLVVGAGGLVGRHLVTALGRARHRVRVAAVPWGDGAKHPAALSSLSTTSARRGRAAVVGRLVRWREVVATAEGMPSPRR